MRSAALRPKISERKGPREAGQSTLEFTLTLLLMFGFFFFYFRLTTVFAFGNFVHYAVYMSARAYLAAGFDQKEQEQRASSVIEGLLMGNAGERYAMFGKGIEVPGGNGSSTIPGLAIGATDQFKPSRLPGWSQGVRYRFQSKIFPLRLGATGSGTAGRALASGSSGAGGDPSALELQAESFLGREPTFRECDTQMTTKGSGGKVRLYDNGC